MIDELFFDFDDTYESSLSTYSNVWFGFYKELIASQKRYDLDKANILPEFNFSNVSFDEYKEKMKKRYLFLAENSIYLLAPLIRSEDELSYLVRSFDSKYSEKEFDGKYKIHLVPDIFLSVLLERFLFEDSELEDDEFYKKVMELKNDPEYLKSVKAGISLAKEDYLVGGLDNIDYLMYELLESVKNYIDRQDECLNKRRKLCVLDEYFGLLLYSNDGHVWTSHHALENQSILDILYLKKKYVQLPKKTSDEPIKSRGVGFTNFIKAFNVKKDLVSGTFKFNRLTETDRQEVYLKLHDELPWDLEIECKLEEPELNSMNDTRLVRPENTKPCGSTFRISEGDIFVTRRGFYHLCSECGYIVKIPPKYISEGIGKRIRERCSKDENLLRKMELISELQALDDRSLPQHKVLFKEKK